MVKNIFILLIVGCSSIISALCQSNESVDSELYYSSNIAQINKELKKNEQPKTGNKEEKNKSEKKQDEKLPPEEKPLTPSQEDSIRKLLLYYNRFQDTTVIVLNDLKVESEKSYLEGFDNAVEEFDNEKFDDALVKFKLYAETLPPNDSLFFEIEFFIAECYVAKDDLNSAKVKLEKIQINPKATDAVMEKVLVRLGQIWCVLDNEFKAEQYFKLLRSKYPKSIYIPLADCDVVK